MTTIPEASVSSIVKAFSVTKNKLYVIELAPIVIFKSSLLFTNAQLPVATKSGLAALHLLAPSVIV